MVLLGLLAQFLYLSYDVRKGQENSTILYEKPIDCSTSTGDQLAIVEPFTSDVFLRYSTHKLAIRFRMLIRKLIHLIRNNIMALPTAYKVVIKIHKRV